MTNRLSYEELIKTCALLGVYVERLAKRVEAQDETMLFIIFQVLKVQAEVFRYTKKTPFKKLDELEKMVKGMNTYYQEKLAELQTSKRKKKETKY